MGGVSSGADVPQGALIVAGFLLLELLNGAWLVFILFSFPTIYSAAYIGSMYSSIHSTYSLLGCCLCIKSVKVISAQIFNYAIVDSASSSNSLSVPQDFLSEKSWPVQVLVSAKNWRLVQGYSIHNSSLLLRILTGPNNAKITAALRNL